MEQSRILNLNSMMIPQSPIALKDQSMSASRDFRLGFKNLVNLRSLSPNLSRIGEGSQTRNKQSFN
jgi:hypothetical protein